MRFYHNTTNRVSFAIDHDATTQTAKVALAFCGKLDIFSRARAREILTGRLACPRDGIRQRYTIYGENATDVYRMFREAVDRLPADRPRNFSYDLDLVATPH